MGDMADYYNDIGGWEGHITQPERITSGGGYYRVRDPDYFHKRIFDIEFKHESEKAYFVAWQGLEFWLPKKIVRDEKGDTCLVHKSTLFKILHEHLKEKFPLSSNLGGYEPLLMDLVEG